jgi:hypothetical protein
MIRHLSCAVTLGVLPALGWAQDVVPSISDCDWSASAENIVEPWETYSRSFSEGQTRLALLDTIEPAVAWARLLVLSPPYDELGGRQCRVIGIDSYGFSGMAFDRLTASYDPARGLTFVVPVQAFDARSPDPVWFTLAVTLNQANGAITADLSE